MRCALRLLWPYLRAHKLRLSVAIAAMLGEIATALLMPVPIQRAIDLLVSVFRHAGNGATTASLTTAQVLELLALAGALLLIALLDALFTYLDAANSARVGQISVTELRRALFNHMQRLSLSFHQGADTQTGDLQLRLGTDIVNLQGLVAGQLSTLVTNAGTAAFMIGALLLLDWRLGLLVALGSVPVYMLARHYRRKVRLAVREARRQEGRVSAMLAETLSAAKLVQVMGREDREAGRLVDATAEGLTFGLEATEAQARFQPAVTLATSSVLALTLLVAAVLVLNGELTIGLLTLALTYARGIFSALRQLAKLPIQTQRAFISAERLSETFARSPDVRDPAHPIRMPFRPLEVEFDSVVFGYRDSHPVLNGLTWKVEAGSTVALVGSTGAGKSTALALIPRLYDVWAGAVRVGGCDVRTVALADLRSRVSIVLQDTLLFRDTVWNNIAYGRPEAAPRDIIKAAQAAGVLTFIDELEMGFDTMVSERGATLSGGQKQCIALARAMLRDAPIVIMDEPTSSLDAATEQLVIQGIRSVTGNRTAIIIAHRFSTIRACNVIAVMEGGRLTEVGPPAQLLDNSGPFSQLSQIQDGLAGLGV